MKSVRITAHPGGLGVQLFAPLTNPPPCGFAVNRFLNAVISPPTASRSPGAGRGHPGPGLPGERVAVARRVPACAGQRAKPRLAAGARRHGGGRRLGHLGLEAQGSLRPSEGTG